jgi:hypothetical protein
MFFADIEKLVVRSMQNFLLTAEKASILCSLIFPILETILCGFQLGTNWGGVIILHVSKERLGSRQNEDRYCRINEELHNIPHFQIIPTNSIELR